MSSTPTRRTGSPLPQSSRLLQHTASTMLKSKEVGGIGLPMQRDSLSFTMSPTRRDAGRADSPTSYQRTNSPRCRAESYNKHFEGGGVANILGGGIGISRADSSAGRAVRRASPHRDDSMFASECNSQHRIQRQASTNSIGSASTSSRHPGLWTRKEGDERIAFTGSRRHFTETTNLGSTTSSPVMNGATKSFELTGDSELFATTSDLGASGNGSRFTKRMISQQQNLAGPSCHVTGSTTDEAQNNRSGKIRPDQERFYRKTAPYYEHDHLLSSRSSNHMEEGSVPNGSAPMPSRPTTILDYRESGWGPEAPRRREVAPVEGHAATASRNVTNLSSHTAAEVGERPNSIRTMAGPPAFVAPTMPRATSPVSQRVSSPYRAAAQGSFTVATMSASPAPMPNMSGTSTPRLVSSPVRVGRAVGLYSPLRQTSIF